MSRTVTLFLVDAGGTPLGALPPYDVPAPWWQEVADVVAGARRTHAVDVTVLRLLRTERPVPHGGAVDYLAELLPVSGSDAGPGQLPSRSTGPTCHTTWPMPPGGSSGRAADRTGRQPGCQLSVVASTMDQP